VGQFWERERIDLLSEIVVPLLAWYDQNARVLPWRENTDPYRVWVSEIMLQQTRVEAVKPYYERFLSALPTIEALADVPEEQLMKLWEGLGYYSRARNLQKAAQIVVNEYDGMIPSSFEELLKLPGLGIYTAGAVGSIAFDIRVPAVDGNVYRVFSRLLSSRENVAETAVKSAIAEEVTKILPERRVGDFNQALMELGATVCLPNGEPKCGECPLSALCLGYKGGIAGELPIKTPNKARRTEERTILLILNEGKVALQKRGKRGLLAGLWEFPNLDGTYTPEQVEAFIEEQNLTVRKIVKTKTAKHVFTHVEWKMTGYQIWAEIGDKANCFTWVDEKKLCDEIAMPSAFRPYLQEVLSLLTQK